MTAVLDKPQTITTKAADSITGDYVFVFCKAGTLPLEWPKDKDGRRCIDKDIKALDGSVIDKIRYRSIETRGSGEKDCRSDGFMRLDLTGQPKFNTKGKHRSQAIDESDAEFLAWVEDFIANSKDPRVAQWGVRVDKGNPFPVPFTNWDTLNEKTCLDMIANMLGEDPHANEQKLTAAAQYELSRSDELGGPRQKLLDGLDELGAINDDDQSAGVEDDTAS